MPCEKYSVIISASTAFTFTLQIHTVPKRMTPGADEKENNSHRQSMVAGRGGAGRIAKGCC